MVVLGSGTIKKGYKVNGRPHFNRWSWNYNDSFICYNDPTIYLDEEILGGWGLGQMDDWYLQNIRDILQVVTEKLGILNENILFYGSSMGGFMSIQLATMIKNSTALAEIPQFELTNWYHWNILKKHLFNGLSDEEIFEKYGYRINVLEMMKKEGYIPKCVLLLDFSVKSDVNLQYLNFFEKLSDFPFEGKENKIKIVIEGKSEGHSAIDRNYALDIINGLLSKNYMIWNNELKKSQLFSDNSKLKKKYNEMNRKYNLFLSSKCYRLMKKYHRFRGVFKR